MLFRLDHSTREMPEIASHIPARSILAVQTRQPMKITKDLEEIAMRGQDDQEYRRLMNLIEEGRNS